MKTDPSHVMLAGCILTIAVMLSWPQPQEPVTTPKHVFDIAKPLIMCHKQCAVWPMKDFTRDGGATTNGGGKWCVTGEFSHLGLLDGHAKKFTNWYVAVLQEPNYPHDPWKLESLSIEGETGW